MFLFLILFSLFLILAENFGWIKTIRSAVEKGTIPTKMVAYRTWQGISGSFSGLFSLSNCPQKIADLEKQIEEYLVLSVKLNVLEEENKALRRQLEAPLPPTTKFLPAKTLGLTKYLTIDKGEEDGVKPGMIVVSENILVGKIIQVTPKTAQVILPTDPDSKIPSRTIKTNARGLVEGQFGTGAVFDRVLQAEVLESGDLLVTTGEGEYERDLLIGKLTRIEKVPVEPFQKGEITPLLDYSKLVNVFVIK